MLDAASARGRAPAHNSIRLVFGTDMSFPSRRRLGMSPIGMRVSPNPELMFRSVGKGMPGMFCLRPQLEWSFSRG